MRSWVEAPVEKFLRKEVQGVDSVFGEERPRSCNVQKGSWSSVKCWGVGLGLSSRVPSPEDGDLYSVSLPHLLYFGDPRVWVRSDGRRYDERGSGPGVREGGSPSSERGPYIFSSQGRVRRDGRHRIKTGVVRWFWVRWSITEDRLRLPRARSSRRHPDRDEETEVLIPEGSQRREKRGMGP